MSQNPGLILTNFKLLTGMAGQETFKTLTISGNKITAVGDHPAPAEGVNNYQTIDLQGLTLAPGFIDLQLNGCGGVNFNSAITEATLDTMHAANLRSGCTTFLPTLITASDDDIKEAVAVVSRYRKRHPDRVLGIHIEGPYINPQRKGIHPGHLVRKPSRKMMNFLTSHAEDIAKLTLAPEVCGNKVIKELYDAGILVAIGHTNATCAEVKAAEQAGAGFVTHLHNAMSPLTSREPGVVGAAFDSSRLCAGIIADGYHLSWENLRIAHRLMQDRLVLVTDATAAAGTDIEQFEFGGHTVYHRDGKCTGADGTLGGSALTMIEAVNNSIKHGISLADTIRMATVNPARILGREQEFGTVSEGAFANLVILDQGFQVKGTISGGSLLWN